MSSYSSAAKQRFCSSVARSDLVGECAILYGMRCQRSGKASCTKHQDAMVNPLDDFGYSQYVRLMVVFALKQTRRPLDCRTSKGRA